MSDIDINRVQQNIKELQDQNAIDFQQWKRLGQEIKRLEGKIKTSDNHLNLLMKKIKSDYESLRKVIIEDMEKTKEDVKTDYSSLKKIIIDENVQFQLNDKIEKNKKEVENINSQLEQIVDENNFNNIPNTTKKIRCGLPIKILIIGDSLAEPAGTGVKWTEMLFDSSYKSFGYNLKENFNINSSVENIAVGGQTIKLLLAQLLSILITIAIAAVGTFIIMFVLKKVMQVRVSPEDEAQGLDISEHGESAYPAFNGLD